MSKSRPSASIVVTLMFIQCNTHDIAAYGTPKLSYVVIFLVALSKNCVNLSMHVIILKTPVVLSIHNVDMPTHCLIMLENHFILSQRGFILSKKHVNLSI